MTGSALSMQDVAEQLDGVARVRAAGRLRPVEVAEAVLPVDVPGVPDVLQQRAGAARGDRDVLTAGRVEHREGVGDDEVQRGVAADAADGEQLELGVQGCEQQGARVVDSRVDVEHDPPRHAGEHTGRR